MQLLSRIGTSPGSCTVSTRLVRIRVRHGGELPAAQVGREDFLGDGRLRDPPHRRLDAETLSRLDGEMESHLDSTRTRGRVAVLV